VYISDFARGVKSQPPLRDRSSNRLVQRLQSSVCPYRVADWTSSIRNY